MNTGVSAKIFIGRGSAIFSFLIALMMRVSIAIKLQTTVTTTANKNDHHISVTNGLVVGKLAKAIDGKLSPKRTRKILFIISKLEPRSLVEDHFFLDTTLAAALEVTTLGFVFSELSFKLINRDIE